MSNTILITGSSSGIGRATAEYFQTRGWNVIATMRKPEGEESLNKLENVLVTRLDVTDHDSIATAVQEGIQRFGKIDVALNNAGYGSYGALEATSIEKIRRQYEVNVIGTLAVAKAVIPHFRKNRKGILINVSSMGGKVTFPLGTLYHGSKFAVEGMSEALSYELEPIGIQVKLIEPGAIKTDFGGRSFDFNVDPTLTEYGDIMNKVTAAFQTMSAGSEAELVAETIFRAATDGSNQMRYVVGPDAEQVIAARKQMNDADYMAMMKSNMGL